MSSAKKTRFFKAKTMQEALNRAARSLGEEAIILKSGENENDAWLMVASKEEETDDGVVHEDTVLSVRLLVEFLEKAGFSDQILAHFIAFARTNIEIGENITDLRPHLVIFFDHLLAERPPIFDFSAALMEEVPTCLFLVGPTGQGKTVTTAKLAVTLMQQGTLPVIASLDVEKSAGTLQLEKLLQVLRLPVHTIHTGEDAHALLATTSPHTPILMDTPGLNVFHAADRSLIGQWKQWTRGHAFGLLRAGGDIRETQAILETLQEEGVARVGITHCDATRHLGTVLSAVFASDMALEFLCDSPFISHAPQVALAETIVDLLISSSKHQKKHAA
ncbi:MAG: hypothetical protein LBQ26_01095 [Holosporales bacterium]|jgi:flagellar biosynthesis GTPase FlhF|nr:hypothetical protein [Holosporales bacterium]